MATLNTLYRTQIWINCNELMKICRHLSELKLKAFHWHSSKQYIDSINQLNIIISQHWNTKMNTNWIYFAVTWTWAFSLIKFNEQKIYLYSFDDDNNNKLKWKTSPL